ncbi:ABC transporter permease [Raoultibacter phocaeensis]|uniref:ABC transporter permease n=1 Tax=Raoultibacter phocaeensis TaxID=2479841 RepID=UPI00111B0443|nr:ABC transporter permease [Raoultibacter phocaeensis]
MVNILRMDFYRAVRSKSLWILLGCIVILGLVAMGSISYMLSPEFLETMQNASGAAASSGFHFGITTPGGDQVDMGEVSQSIEQAQYMLSGLTPMALVGNIFMNGGGLACLFVVFIGIFFAAEFENGFSKNVFTAFPNRAVFLITRVVEIVLFAVVFTLVTVGATLIGAAVFGIEMLAAPMGDMALWFALVVLVLSGMGMLTALFVWLTRKMAAAIAIGIVVGSGIIVSLVQAVLSLFPSISDLGNFTLYACMRSLGSGIDFTGGLTSVHIAAVGLVFLAGYAALSLLILKKKDI